MQRHLKLIHDLVKGKPAHLRSPKWHKVEKEHLEKEPECQWCGAKKEDGAKLQVHHIVPFHVHPGLELEDFNLITLCEEGGYLNCHLFHGHSGDWKDFNKDVREECDEHKKTPDRQILEAVRKQDPLLYNFLITAKREREKHGGS
ncbi:MAG: HNH endonuclease [Syntrophobacteraceae bacterium]